MCLQDIETIRNIIFREYGKVQKITFPYLFIENPVKKPRMILYEQNTDKIIDLPESMDEYMKLLGPNTRRRVKDGRKRIVKDHPDFQILFYEGKDILREHIVKIMELNKERMTNKGKKYGHSDKVCDIFHQYSHIRGVLCLCAINNNIIGGSISWVFEQHVYTHVIAHDNAYNSYRLGYVTLSYTIQHMIERNMKYFHFMWGEEEYNYRFLGKPNSAYNVMVFKKSTSFLLNNCFTATRLMMKKIRKRIEKNVILKKIYRKLQKINPIYF
jgi:hypothetical protein